MKKPLKPIESKPDYLAFDECPFVLESFQGELPRFLYHRGNPFFRKQILRSGLMPKVGDSYEAHWNNTEKLPPLVFLYDLYRMGEHYDSTYDDDCWMIDSSMLDLNHLYLDPEPALLGAYAYTKVIPSTAMQIIYYGSGKPLE